MLLLKPNIVKEALIDLVAKVGKHVYTRNGVLTDVKSFGTVQLGYGIKKLDGRYYQGTLMQMTMMTPPSFNSELHYLNKEDRLLRWLLVKHRDIKPGLEYFGEKDSKLSIKVYQVMGDDKEDESDEESDTADEIKVELSDLIHGFSDSSTTNIIFLAHQASSRREDTTRLPTAAYSLHRRPTTLLPTVSIADPLLYLTGRSCRYTSSYEQKTFAAILLLMNRKPLPFPTLSRQSSTPSSTTKTTATLQSPSLTNSAGRSTIAAAALLAGKKQRSPRGADAATGISGGTSRAGHGRDVARDLESSISLRHWKIRARPTSRRCSDGAAPQTRPTTVTTSPGDRHGPATVPLPSDPENASILFVSGQGPIFVEQTQIRHVEYGVSVSWFDRTKNWVSKNGDFAFGFLEKYGGDDVDGFVVGIRYNLGYQGDINVPVWIVGGGLRKLAKSTAQFEEEYGAHRFLKSRREI
nr:MATH and LRR domain-containing protein PFE0570w [Ipomoea batatas]